MAEEKYNMKNPAVKRILQEVKEMQNNPIADYMSLPLEDNIFEWHFAIRGPSDSEFEGGIYHGRIQLPPEYPFKPPAFMLLTPNGRFETQTKICLSISQHHPEHWQPSWSVRTALVALIAFMPTKPDGALGSLDYTKEERRALAIKSRLSAPKFGNTERQALIDEIHQAMIKTLPPVPELPPANVDSAEPVEDDDEDDEECEETLVAEEPDRDAVVENVHEVNVNANAGPLSVSFSAGFRSATRAQAVDAADTQPQHRLHADHAHPAQAGTGPGTTAQVRPVVQQPPSDSTLTILAIALTIAILALIIKKLMRSQGMPAGMPESMPPKL
ncbi:hypothetical protein KC19_12G162400 [Ceratodon purpureus]|uniref:UBC core domain-containing protein n=1 Tax=Ceratodon purpureus TaxID=3225 RepID=A0A8T0G8H4_CERPU|nr:hypothetical protein KC19_12G162400 [Ceratodon purpureus]